MRKCPKIFFSLPPEAVLSDAIQNVDPSTGSIIKIEDYILTENAAVKLHLIHDLLYVKAKFRCEMLWLSKFEFISQQKNPIGIRSFKRDVSYFNKEKNKKNEYYRKIKTF